MRTAISLLALAALAGCTTTIATVSISEAAVEVALTTAWSVTEADMAAVRAEAELRCGKYDRDAEYASERVETVPLPYCQHCFDSRTIYLYQCVPRVEARLLH